MNIDALPSTIRPYLQEIADRLWTGHASVMVGAGYSKNAINTSGNNRGLPNWNELGDIFYEKINGERPDINSRYLNALKLAEELQTAFGRSILDQILQQNIPDKDFEPSDVHVKLLELPWSDVFTTNYDTLLERTCENVISRRYDVVLNTQDIVYSNRPRIVKLHGSFPSERPFIITEEDYRTYPNKFAPFVNTVQQSLLENTLCLLGFSGDDPNFLKWIGWISDNIGKENSPKIYLIGILYLSDAQKKLLDSKNIVSVDLGLIPNTDGDHKKALNIFLDFLAQQRKSRENLEWGMKKHWIHSPSTTLIQAIEIWKSERLAYPNWVVCPQENRESIFEMTSQYINHLENWDALSYPDDLNFLYELNWRLEVSLFPIYNKHIIYFERILARYAPIDLDLGTYYQGDGLLNENWRSIKDMWLELKLAVVRFYREEGFRDKWAISTKLLEKLNFFLSPDQEARFYYEKVLMATFDSDAELISANLQLWPVHLNDPFWEAKRAMLLAESGLVDEADAILESCLTTVRKRLNLTPIATDYKWVSQEAYLMFLVRALRWNSTSHNLNSFNNSVGEAEHQNFDERWNMLLQFKCAPWLEIKYFDHSLQIPYDPIKDKTVNKLFAIGRSTITHHLGGQDSSLVLAYTFLRFTEEIGIPLGLRIITPKTIKGTLERIYPNSPSWAMGIFLRTRESDLTNIVFDRKSLSKFSSELVDRIIEDYLNKFERLFRDYKQSPIGRNFLRKLPEILSHLCVKCSDKVKIRIYQYYILQARLPEFPKNLKKLWMMLFDSSNDNVKSQVFSELLKVPIIDNENVQLDLVEPFLGLEIKDLDETHISEEMVNELLQKLTWKNEVRKRSFTRLMFFYRKQLLDISQTKRFFDNIWALVDKNGFPLDTPLYNFAYVTLPYPKDQNILEHFKNYIIENSFDIQGSDESVGISGGVDRYADELRYGSAGINKHDGVLWTSDELKVIVRKCHNWWETDKNYLIDPKYKAVTFGRSLSEEFSFRFHNLTEIISRVFGYQKSTMNQETIIEVIDIVNDMEKIGIPVLKAKVAFAEELHYENSILISEIEHSLISNNKDQIGDALAAIALSMEYFQNTKNKDVCKQLLNMAIQVLKWRKLELFHDTLLIIENIISNKPELYLDIQSTIHSTLDYLSKMTNISNEDHLLDVDIAETLEIRRCALRLANTIYKIDNQCRTSEIMVWKAIAEDSEEFSDIKNRWT